MWITPPSKPVSIRRKWNAVLTVFFFIITFLPVSTYAADTIVDYDYTQEITDLTKNYDSILDYTESKRCLAYSDEDKTLCSTYEDTILYLYKTDTAAPPTVLNKNTEQLSPTTYKIYSSDVYYQDEQTNTWKQTEYGVVEKQDFQAVQDYELKSADEVSFLNNPFKIYKVNAQSPIYPGVDSTIQRGGVSEDFTTISAGNGTQVESGTELLVGWQSDGSTFSNMKRSRLTFDTSSLSDSVASSTLMLKAHSKYQGTNSDFSVNIFGLTPGNETTAGITDYENSTETQFSTGISSDAMSNGNYYSFLLNTDGKNQIDVDGYSHFALRTNEDAAGSFAGTVENNIQYFYDSSTSDTTSDPYLLVETEEEATTTPETEATTTLDTLPSLPFIDDLTVITGRTDHYESSTTAADWSELHYYRVPAFLWWILTSTFLFILGFILSQIQRILRKKK